MEPIFTLRIESLAFGGDGIGRADRRACFVPYSAPGDLLSVRVTEDRGSFLRAEILEIREPGPARRQPRCPHFGRCGGCTWQHIDYAAQLDAKREILVETMARIGGIEAPVRPLVASAQEYGYRTRARLQAAGARVGYFERFSNRVVGVSECPILAPQLEAKLTGTVRSTAAGPPSTGSAGTLELELTGGGPDEVAVRRTGGAATSSRSPRRRQPGPKTDDNYAFHQVNLFVNPELVRLVDEAIAEHSADRPLEVVDLYCGDGNLSLPLAPRAATVDGFDTSEESIRRAAEAARAAGLANAGYSRTDVAAGLETVAAARRQSGDTAREPRSLCIIADPPRSGLRRVVPAILALQPDLFVYVSCNPPTLARDSRLIVDGGMRLEYLQPLDMFPQTFHLETLAVFTRNRPRAQGPSRVPTA